MNKLAGLRNKKKTLVVGLMSGTSADAMDAVLAEISGSGTAIQIRQIAFSSLPYPRGYKAFLLGNSLPGSGTVDAISQLNILVAHFSADAVKSVARKARVPLSKIDLIGSHGQTLHHIPDGRILYGKKIRSTLQIGDPSTLATLTGIPVVANFRTADMALGGQGAPLVPYFDFVMFRSSRYHRAILNIGGIANITLLRRNCSLQSVVAFDTGPGNMVIDALMKKFYRREFDDRGATAKRGAIEPSLIKLIMRHPYFSQSPPKSTGREMFGSMFVDNILRHSRGIPKENIIATVTECTALTVFQQYSAFLSKKLRGALPDELIVSGGGTRNTLLMNTLRKYFFPAKIIDSSALGVSGEAKEALCFALLAYQTIREEPSNIPSVTGAERQTILGEICL